jgi:allophanate hydrolase subunit 2
VPGAIQVPPDGQPIILGWDGPVTGGYPVIAGVISVDWPRLAQLRPGDAVRFVTIEAEAARSLAEASAWRVEEMA